MAKKVLITGAAGLIGWEFFNYIKSQNIYEITAVDNFSRHGQPCIDIIQTDIENWVQTNSNNFDYIYHFAAINGTENFYQKPLEVLFNNTNADLSVIKFAETKTNCRLIYASTSEIIAGTNQIPSIEQDTVIIENIYNPRWSYRLPKLLSENYLANSNIDYSIIRFFNIIGERSYRGHFIFDIVKKIQDNCFEIEGAKETRSFCYVQDILESIKIIGEMSSREVFNLGSDKEIKIIDAANLIAELFGHKDPMWQFKSSKTGSVKRRCPNIQKIKDLNPNFAPKTFMEILLQIKDKL